MKLQDQCVSLELAKKLKELGVKQESEFEWEIDKGPSKQQPVLRTSGIRGCPRCGAVINGLPRPTMFSERIAAFTVAELGEMLNLVKIKNLNYCLRLTNLSKKLKN